MNSAFSRELRFDKAVVRGRRGIVAAQNRRAAAIGVAILDAGGHAVDAAIATSFALGAAEPWMSGIGGGGAMLVRERAGGPVRAIDAGMIAPRALDPARYPLASGSGGDLFGWPAVLEDRNVKGPLSVCTPTLLRGLELAHARFARMPWAELLAPAVALAREGLAVDWYAALLIGSAAKDLARDPGSAARWLEDGFVPYPDWTGTPARVDLGALAGTLDALAHEGVDLFYKGAVGSALVSDLEGLDCPLSRADLECAAAAEVEPLEVRHGSVVLHAMPGLYAGATLADALWRIEPRTHGERPDALAYIQTAQALIEAIAVRLETMGGSDPGLSSTSHLCVIDEDGGMVALTQTLLSLFGSKVMSPTTGIMLNNGVMWFDPRPGRPNSIGARKRPLSNMCPVIGEAGRRAFALGASGGRRILPAVLQIARFVGEFGMTLEDAFACPRIDVSATERITMDARLDPAISEALRARFEKPGMTLVSSVPMVYPLSFACPSAVIDGGDGSREGTAEPSQPWAGAVAQT